MPALHWARLKAEGPYPLRRGAWYRVTEFERHEIVLDVQWRTVSVPRSCIEVVEQRPLRWTVVPRPAGAVRMPREWKRYAVCPSCHERVALPARTSTRSLTCDRCRGAFEIDWGEGYLAT